ncbi:MAG TPA: cytochrome c peroxidase [Kofleriaceae bacterium]|jgi:cytochrome c peroxidase
MRAIWFAAAFVLLGVGACSGRKQKPPPEPPATPHDASVVSSTPDGAALIAIPPAPPLPDLPVGLPPPPSPLFTAATPTPELVALGELLFWDTRLSTTNTLSCASCHVPADGFSGATRQLTAAGKPNLRKAPALVNLAWSKELGWDGRSTTMEQWLSPHVRGQLGEDLATSVPRIAELPVYKANFARSQTATMDLATTARRALESYVLTRYAGNSQWDKVMSGTDPARDQPDFSLSAGRQLFDGKAQCAVCHTPPLFTDGDYHRIGLVAVADEGRGRVDKAAKEQGAFRTPTLRGAAARKGFFHDASASTLAAAIDWHLAGGVGQKADKSIIDPALTKISLTPDERAALQTYVEGLTEQAPPPTAPALP